MHHAEERLDNSNDDTARAGYSLDWAAAEGWNPGLCDADCFYAADPNGFFIGLFGNEPNATISAVKYGDSFGFIGFHIVKLACRGMGYCIQIWNAGLAYLRGRTVGLDGVVAQQSNSAKSGFVLAYRNIRFQGSSGGHFPTDSRIIPLSTIPFYEICDYDRPFFPDHRVQFLRCWVDLPGSTAFGIQNHGKLAEYGVMRSCRSGHKVGQLFADSPQFAEQLFLALEPQAQEGAPVFLDTPAVNSAAADLVKRHNMVTSFETARMYTRKHPNCR